MKKTLFTFVSMIGFALLTACGGSPVDDALSQVDKSIEKLEKLEKQKDKISKEDLDKLAKEMEEPVNILQKAVDNNEIGGLTKIKIIAKLGQWAVLATSVGLQNLNLDEIGSSNGKKETEQ